MLGKNSSQKQWQSIAKQDHFAIRKLSIGAVSILLGVAFLASGQTVKADTITPSTDSSNIQKTKLTTYSDLNLFLKSHDDAKANRDNKNNLTTKPATVNNNQTNIKQADTGLAVQTQTGRVHQGKWNNINVTYNDETQELTLLGSTENAPAIMQNGEQLDSLWGFGSDIEGYGALKKITIQGKIKAQGSASGLFNGLGRLTSIEGLANLDTSEITDMSSMFNGCERLTSLDLSHFDTSSVTDMSNMFGNCRKLSSLDLSHFDTSNVTNMSDMFEECRNLTSLDLSHFDTSKVTNMYEMFGHCRNLTSLDLSHFDTSKVTDMREMFENCRNLTSLDLSHFDTSKVTEMSGMFENCRNLTSLDLSHFNTSKVINMTGMFRECRNLTSLDVSHFNTSNVTYMEDMFYECNSLIHIDVSHFDTSNAKSLSFMFFNCLQLTSLDLSYFDTSKVTEMEDMFNHCRNLTSLDLSHFDTSKVTNMSEMFYGCKNLTSLDLSHFDTSKVINMGSMFEYCENLTSLDISHFDTSKVTEMPGMLYCSKLRWLSLGKNFKFLQHTYLEDLPGKWLNWGVTNQQLPKGTKQWTSNEFTENYNGPTDYDTYIRLANLITVQYRDQNGNKIPDIADEQQYGNVDDSLIDKTNPNSILSFKRQDIAGYNFDHAEINGQKVDLADIKYTDNPQTLTLFYVKVNSDNNGGNNPNDNNGSDNSNGSNNTNDSNGSDNANDSNDSNGQNNLNNSSGIKIPVEFTTNVTLKHNAYLYDGNGNRANDVTFKAGSIITVSGNKNINGRQFYILIDNNRKYYVAVGNVKPVSRKLKHNAYVYNKYCQRIKKTGVFKKAKRLNTFGDPVTIRGRHYFIIDNSRFVKAANFASISSAKIVTTAGIKAGTRNKSKAAAKTIMHNAYLYNNQGKRANKIVVLAGSKINTLNLAKIENRLYYKLEDGLHIAAGNIKAAKLKLEHNAYIYSQYGNRIGKKVLKKRKFVKTYGYAVSIKHKKYYIIAKNKFVKKANFR